MQRSLIALWILGVVVALATDHPARPVTEPSMETQEVHVPSSR